jgi:hypothetical protein
LIGDVFCLFGDSLLEAGPRNGMKPATCPKCGLVVEIMPTATGSTLMYDNGGGVPTQYARTREDGSD